MHSGYIPTKEIIKTLKPYSKKKIVLPSIIFTVDLVLYISSLLILLNTTNFYLKFILSILLGLLISFVFIIGHDCCHLSFTSSIRLNKLLGRIAFAPSLHNYSLWNLGHNKTHHTFTNLKTKDYVYTPLSPEEYYTSSKTKKWKYKLYRSILGHCPYYLIEIWFKKILFPFKDIEGMTSKKKLESILDLLPLVIYLVGISILISFKSHELNQGLLANFIFALIIPFLTWNWIMGFAIYQHHTNPLTKWYSNEEEWEYWEVQLEHSTHIRFPKPLNFILHNIMEHTAHHGNMQIPLYELSNAQNALESEFKDRIQVINWNIKFYWNSIKTCKLYDYDKHVWLDFKRADNRTLKN